MIKASDAITEMGDYMRLVYCLSIRQKGEIKILRIYELFDDFDPLQLSENTHLDESFMRDRQKRNIHSILHSYVGWYDPFSELIQNALDSVDKRILNAALTYEPTVNVIIDTSNNSVTVSDNGTGLEKRAFEQFLAPNVSFKDDAARGSKGVGATYIAYGFNYLRVDTKTKNFAASGEMEGARNWLHEKSAPQNPRVYPCESSSPDSEFEGFDSGTSVTVRFDANTRPSDLTWPSLNNAHAWATALRIKTALGAANKSQNVGVNIVHIDKLGKQTTEHIGTVQYLSPHQMFSRAKNLEELNKKLEQNLKKYGAGAGIPNSIKNLDAVYIDWENENIFNYIDSLSKDQKSFLKEHPIRVLGCYLYSARVWDDLSKKIGCRPTANIFNPGIQLAADNMPQGEVIQVPLTRYTGRQNQVHFLMHFTNCTVDLGRKGFHKDFVDMATFLAREIVQKEFSKVKQCLRIDDFRKSNLIQQETVSSWKSKLIEHEHNNPLLLKNENFFKPINEVSVTAEPSREQDVIALFNQLVAGGVIRGIKVVGTNEMMIYDGAFRVCCGPKYKKHEYHEIENPLGVYNVQILEFESKFPSGFTSSDIKILEYKFSVDGFITDITTGDKKVADVDLLIAWEMGEEYEQFFTVQSLLVSEGETHRDYHGLTHQFFDEHGNKVMDGIILKDLVAFLNDPDTEIARQGELYE